MIAPFLVSGVLLIVLDTLWLFSMRHFFRRQIGHLMKERVLLFPAFLFYILYSAGLVFFVFIPFGTSELSTVFLTGALFGLIAYGAYDLTNHATLSRWPIKMTLVDMLWGAFMTGAVSVLSLLMLR